jgi:tRNA(Arg) A34 adenosine deaminase TadA
MYTADDLQFSLNLPEWAVAEHASLPSHIERLEDRMAEVIRFSQLNFEKGTGGPFAAGIFERDSGRLVVIGVNRVMPSQCSSAHAEIMTFSLAQKILGTWDLGADGLPTHQMVVNWRPCAMCYGAVVWSGVRSLVVAGSGPELEDITGFDEGPVHPEWRTELEKRGIEVTEDVGRQGAIDVYKAFARSQNFVYNARQGS